jgi:putative nucleotidyltransferase with HDIG domain
MKAATDFLTHLAQAVSTMSLYEEDHPSREEAVDAAWESLQRLQEEVPTPRFTFLDEEILLGSQPLRALRRWSWGRRLSRVGIQRLEFEGHVTREDLDAFLDDALFRLLGNVPSSATARQERPTEIRYGAVGIEDESGDVLDEVEEMTTATLGYDLKEEVETVEWLHDELKGGHRLHLLEAETLVRSLSVAMHGDQEFLIPLLRMKEFDQYTTTHAMNVSVLAMALAEFIGLTPAEVRNFGISGLLHDLGKVTIPDEILNKPGKLTLQEREVMNGHTVEGARLILESRDHLELAAVVAYEHHMKIDGTGYPSFRFPRKCHQASDLVHVCDVFDALRTHRPYRDAWPQKKVLDYMEAGIGTEFDEHLARAFVRMMRTWEGRVAEMERPDQPVIQPVEDIGGTEATETPGGSSQDPAINGPDGTDDPGTVGSGG